MRKACIDVYLFDELSSTAKEKARTWYRTDYPDYNWWDSVEEDFKAIAKLCGWTISKTYFSGFSSQGDGACFEGTFRASDVDAKGLKEYAPKDILLHSIVGLLSELIKEIPETYAEVAHSGYYYHEYCTNFSVQLDSGQGLIDNWEAEQKLINVSRSLMRWYYRQLEKEYEYLMSDESVDENIQINEYEFTEDGKRYAY